MIKLTIGQVAGLINVGVIVVQFTFPLLVVFILVGILKDENNAVTWSVVGRLLNGSSWPILMGSDTAASSKVSKRSLVVSTFSTLCLFLLAIAAAVAPLGLYEMVEPIDHKAVAFGYAKDDSILAQGISSRDHYISDRLCGGFTHYGFVNCPGQAEGFTWFTNATGTYIHSDDGSDPYISSAIPENLTKIYSSGCTGDRATVASVFDIEYRSYLLGHTSDTDQIWSGIIDFNVDQQKNRTRGVCRTYESLILESDTVITEGLVVDMKNGGLGFRNHTIPTDIRKGSEWTEGLLWIEPESVCVDTNLTLDYYLGTSLGMTDAVITDRGGFTNMPVESPYADMSNAQERPNLRGRAYAGAVLNNFNLLVYFDKTANSSWIGKTYPVPAISAFGLTANQVSLTRYPQQSWIVIPGEAVGLDETRAADKNKLYYSGFSVRDVTFSTTANTSYIAVDGGLMVGISSRSDGSTINEMQPGTNMTAPLFSCVTALKASIKDVSFFINGSISLSNLKVTDIKPREYESNESAPLWATENTGLAVSDVDPLWGIVDDKYEGSPNMWTIRKDSYYLPASRGLFANYYTVVDALAGTEAPQLMLSALYWDALSNNRTYSNVLPEYSGATSYSLSLRWQNFTKHATTDASMLNLVWTDLMANYVVSRRSTLTANQTVQIPPEPALLVSQPISVQQFDTKIKYHLVYAIPLFIFGGIYLVLLVIALVLWLSRRSTFTLLGAMLNQTSVGRAVTTDRDQAARSLSTKEWIRKYGDEAIGISKKDMMHKPDKKEKESKVEKATGYQKVETVHESPAKTLPENTSNTPE